MKLDRYKTRYRDCVDRMVIENTDNEKRLSESITAMHHGEMY
jgi:hypothetical protein